MTAAKPLYRARHVFALLCPRRPLVRRAADAEKRQLQGVIEGLRRDVAALQVGSRSCMGAPIWTE